MKATAVIALAASVVGCVCPAAAQTLAAVVEDVRGNPGVGFMDYVEAGRVFQLGPKDSIVLGYIKSCVRETIAGGTITIGADRSHVEAGRVERAIVACDAERMFLTSQPANETAGMVFRSWDRRRQLPEPQFTLFGASPIIQAAGGGRVIIERLDATNERHVVPLTKSPGGDIFDFARSGAALVPGGLYRALANGHEMIFKVAASAKPGHTPVVGRLIRFAPAN